MNDPLEYWEDDGWLVGWLKAMPAVMSQGADLNELQANICDALVLLCEYEGQRPI
ncbi:MAG: type II toxin-antitoxin system HicB family antitoxin [Opitutales bacterium]